MNQSRLKNLFVLPALLAIAATGGATHDTLAQEKASCTIERVALEREGPADVILIEARGSLGRVHHFTLQDPRRLVVDLYGCKAGVGLRPSGRGDLVSGPLRIGKHPGKIRVAGNLPEGSNVKREVAVGASSVVIRLVPGELAWAAETVRETQSSGEKGPWEGAASEEKGPPTDQDKAPGAAGERPPREKSEAKGKTPGGMEKSPWTAEASSGKPEPEKSPWAEAQGSQEKDGEGSPWAEAGGKQGGEEQPAWAEEKATGKGQEESPWEEMKEKGGSGEKPPWDQGAQEKPGAAQEKPPWEEKPTKRVSPFAFSGKLWNKLAGDVDEENRYEDDASNHAELLMEGKYTAGSFLALLSVEAQHFADLNHGEWDGEADLYPFNAYVSYGGGHYNVKIGQQIVKWGKADEISPLDIINPEDLRDGPQRPRDERKLPIPMVNLEGFHGVYKIQALYIPFFHESKFDLKDDDWAFFDHYQEELGYFQVKEKDVPHTLGNGEWGIRGSGTVRNLDYAVSYFYTRDDLPSLGSISVPPIFPLPVTNVTIKKLAQTSRTLNQPVPLAYDRTRVAGFEFETTLGDFGVRGEAAYYHKQSFLTNRLKKVRKPVVQYALGMDYQGKESLYVNLQFLQSIVRDYDRDILFTEKTTTLLFGKVSKGILDDNLELGIRAYYNAKQKDYYYNPMLVVKYWQDVNIELGADILGGHSDTTMGLFRDNDQAYALLRYFF